MAELSRRILGSLAGALLAAALFASVAQAGAPARVTVRAESLTHTLVSTTLVTSRKAAMPDGKDVCSGTSAGGALWQATGGKWSGTWFASFGDYTVDSILGAKPAGFDYWAFWLNGKVSSLGACGSELQPGDQVLFFICHDATAPDYTCKNRPLELVAPRGRVRAGRPFTVRVFSLKDDGTKLPAAGAVVRGGVAPVTTGADGRARVTVATGQRVLRARLSGDVPSDPIHCAIGAHGGFCGDTDRTPPTLAVAGIHRGEVLAAAQAPRELRGVARDPSGVTVSLRLTRTAAGRCAFLDGVTGSFRHCGRKRPALFAVGDRQRWSYLLSHRLAPGRYVLDVRAVDGAGNARTLRIRFRVVA